MMAIDARRFWRWALLGVLALAGGCGHGDVPARSTERDQPAVVQVASVSVRPISRSISLPAQVIADQQATLYAKVSGYLRTISVDKGDKVKAGDLLAQIDMPELAAARAKQQAELRAAEADYDRLKASLERTPDLVVPDAVDQARGRFEVARATLDQSETLLRYATIRAPFSGIITQRFVDPGALIQGGPTGAIVSLMDFSRVRLQIAVPEDEATRIAVGQPVAVTTENLPGARFEGTVARFSYALDPAARTMLAEASLDNQELLLRPGMLVTASIGIERKERARVIPVGALSAEKANAFAYTVDQGRALKHAIKVGFNDGQFVEVLEGLTDRDTVILVATSKVTDGQPVRLAGGS